MEKPQSQQTLQTEEEVTLVVSGEEETLVAPRFDDEEALVARPVVPLDAEAAEAHAQTAAPYATATPPPAYARRSLVPRRSWVLALVLISVLVGGVLGGAGLYLYQRQSQDDRAVADTPTETPAETQPQQQQQPAPEPTVEASNAPQPEAPAVAAEPTAAPDDAPDVSEDETVAAPPAREPKTEPAAGRRDDTEADRNAGTPKRGKKGERDAEAERPRPVARAEAEAPREARRVDTIFYRERRAMRRERARARRDGGGVDRLRRIFEGAPE